MPILDPPPLLELLLIVCFHLLELSLTFVYNSVHFKNKVVGNSKNLVKRQIHYRAHFCKSKKVLLHESVITSVFM